MIRVANAPVSWGVIEFDDRIGGGIPWVQVLDEMVETGYAGTELGELGFFPTDPVELLDVLSSRNLAMIGAFVPVDLRRPDAIAPGRSTALGIAELIAAAATSESAPGPFIVLSDDNGRDPVRTKHAGRVRSEMQLSAADWRSFLAGAHEIAHAVGEQTGLRTVFHHHSAGFVETPEEIRRFLAETDPDLIGIVFDTGHYVYGTGGAEHDLALVVRDYAPRIRHVHFKDCHPTVAINARANDHDYFEALRAGLFCELGDGEVDFAAVLTALQDVDYSGWIVVEQDIFPGMGTPRESAQRNREYLRTIGL